MARYGLIAAWLIYSAVLGMCYAHLPPSPDQQVFDYAGWVAATGGRLFIDVIEQNWPGAMWLHALAAELFGVHLWTFRAFDYGLMLAAAAAMLGLLRSIGARRASWLVVPLYQGLYVTQDRWFTGQRDIISAEIMLAAGLALVQRLKGGSRGWLVLVGAGAFLATMIRPTFLLCAPLFVLVDLVTARRNARTVRDALIDGAIAGAVFIACAAALVAYASSTGALELFRQAALAFNAQVYSGQHGSGIFQKTLTVLALSWWFYALFAAAGLALWLRSGERRVLGLLGAVVATTLVSAIVSRAGFGYHFGGLLPVMTLLFAYALGAAFEHAERAADRRLELAAIALALVCAAFVARKAVRDFAPQGRLLSGSISYLDYLAANEATNTGVTFRDIYALAERIRAESELSGTALVWDRAVAINTLAQRRSPTPFITSGMLRLAGPRFQHSAAWLGQLERGLSGERPAAFVVMPGPGHDERAAYTDTSSAANAIVLRALAERYELAGTFGSFELYRLASNARRSAKN